MSQINISGSNPIDEKKRVEAINKILELSTRELSNLASLSNNSKARGYLSDDNKFKRLKLFL